MIRIINEAFDFVIIIMFIEMMILTKEVLS